MKRKIIDLDTFFNKKNTFDKKVFRQLKRFNTREEKKKYLDDATIEQTDLHITEDDYNAIREKKTSSALYIQRLNDGITSKYNEFNQYKLDVLYDFEIMDQDGVVYGLEGRTALGLCRCGLSSNKPFCDGSHRNNFECDSKAFDLPPMKTK